MAIRSTGLSAVLSGAMMGCIVFGAEDLRPRRQSAVARARRHRPRGRRRPGAARVERAAPADPARPAADPDLQPVDQHVGRLVCGADAGLCRTAVPVPERAWAVGNRDRPADDPWPHRGWYCGASCRAARRSGQRGASRRRGPGDLRGRAVPAVAAGNARPAISTSSGGWPCAASASAFSSRRTTGRSSARRPSRVRARQAACWRLHACSGKRPARSPSAWLSISSGVRIAPHLMLAASIAALIAAGLSLTRLRVAPPSRVAVYKPDPRLGGAFIGFGRPLAPEA